MSGVVLAGGSGEWGVDGVGLGLLGMYCECLSEFLVDCLSTSMFFASTTLPNKIGKFKPPARVVWESSTKKLSNCMDPVDSVYICLYRGRGPASGGRNDKKGQTIR